MSTETLQVGTKIEIREVRTRQDRDAFVRMPWPIYADDPQWVPPLLIERKEFIDPKKHYFYRHGTAALFLASQQGRDVGRILVSDDPNYNRDHGANVGCFGMFESVDDPRGPCSAGYRRRLAAQPAAAPRSWARSTIRRITPAGCWSMALTRRHA